MQEGRLVSPCGGIGRHRGLKIPRYMRVGSIPAAGTSLLGIVDFAYSVIHILLTSIWLPLSLRGGRDFFIYSLR